MDRLALRAHAKLNLGLHVLRRRYDGFHDIDTLFVRLELHDELLLERAPSLTGEVVAEAGTPTGGLRMDAENMVMRAASSYLDAAGERGAVRVRLLKRIPVAAGLGGGSSDAAQTLLGLARLHPAPVDLAALGNELGSDLAFFLMDEPAAWGSGRGTHLEPARLPRLDVVLANPGIEVSAAEAYGLVEEFDPTLERTELVRRLAAGEEPGYRNTLQTGVAKEFPLVGEALAALEDAGLAGVMMSGSGPTCFGLAGSAAQAAEAAQRLRTRYPEWWVWHGPAAV